MQTIETIFYMIVIIAGFVVILIPGSEFYKLNNNNKNGKEN